MLNEKKTFTRSAAAVALALGLVTGLTACGEGSPVDNIVGGAVDSGIESLKGTALKAVEDAAGEALNGAGITTDGTLPSSFPAEVPLVTGTTRGGGAGPDGTGWVAQVAVSGADQFAVAQQQLEAAGFTASGVDTDADSGFGTFTGATYRVVLTVSTDSAGQSIATYVVTPV
ncbi:hypothetical protein [Frigoribacterium sp. VKM Ac-2836]|uniref:hypothetical protein n=1 Tax=Frigoribacterium sp. VKM Ac-2836 TaxID=2739014 RepID=UPI001565FC52|nr:hypothetical protein [Frigoribacterium sp. VKM Ac-2836]NRD27139.1 hypothetical protein [Frigoribacterium sp. VKM Ac-2836]